MRRPRRSIGSLFAAITLFLCAAVGLADIGMLATQPAQAKLQVETPNTEALSAKAEAKLMQALDVYGLHGEGTPDCSGVPTIAAAAGYCTPALVTTAWNTTTVDNSLTYNSGFQWCYYNWFGNTGTNANTTLNGTNVVIGTGGNVYGATLTTACKNGSTYHGRAFGGGGYFEFTASMLLPGSNQTPASISANSWAQLWTDMFEHVAQGLISGFSNPVWLGQGPTSLHFIEPDIMENFEGAYSGNLNQVAQTSHDWWTVTACAGCNTFHSINTNIASLSGASHVYAMLWTPATGSTLGKINFYVDGTLEASNTYHKYSWSENVTAAPSTGSATISVQDATAAALGSFSTDIVSGYDVYDVTAGCDLGIFNGTWAANVVHLTANALCNGAGVNDVIVFTPQPPPGTNGVDPCSAPWCYGAVDLQHLIVTMGSANAFPVTVFSVKVYQANTTNDLLNLISWPTVLVEKAANWLAANDNFAPERKAA